jgi:putative transposase
MARDNPLWGAERIRGELLKLGIRASKRTVQKYTRPARPTRPTGQTWGTFLRTHAHEIWACDFLQVTDLLCRPLFAFFLVEHGSRRVVHVGVTRHPTDDWVAQQLREATPYGERPRFLLRDNDSMYGARFAQVAEASGIAVVRTPVGAPRAKVCVSQCTSLA